MINTSVILTKLREISRYLLTTSWHLTIPLQIFCLSLEQDVRNATPAQRPDKPRVLHFSIEPICESGGDTNRTWMQLRFILASWLRNWSGMHSDRHLRKCAGEEWARYRWYLNKRPDDWGQRPFVSLRLGGWKWWHVELGDICAWRSEEEWPAPKMLLTRQIAAPPRPKNEIGASRQLKMNELTFFVLVSMMLINEIPWHIYSTLKSSEMK